MMALAFWITAHPFSDALARLAPVFGILAFLYIKNRLLFSVVPDAVAARSGTMLITDFALSMACFIRPTILGRRNAEFIANRLEDVVRLSRVASAYRRRLHVS